MRTEADRESVKQCLVTVSQRDGLVFERNEGVIEEAPLSIVINAKAYAVMMITPADTEEFVLGFLFTDGIIQHASDVLAWELVESQAAFTVYVQVSEARARIARERMRGVIGASGCGLCGIPRADERMDIGTVITAKTVVSSDTIEASFSEMQSQQRINRCTGTAHAAILVGHFDPIVREDIGRHNAVDKVVGHALRNEYRPGNPVLLGVSSRLTFEIVHKAARLQVPVVAAISGVSTLAIKIAEQAGIAVVAYAREGRMTIYSHKERIALHPEGDHWARKRAPRHTEAAHHTP